MENFTKEDFVRIYHDMVVIREFETMLNLIKTLGEYNGIPYSHPGPATFPSDRKLQLSEWPICWMKKITSLDRTALMAKYWPKVYRPFINWTINTR